MEINNGMGNVELSEHHGKSLKSMRYRFGEALRRKYDRASKFSRTGTKN